MSLTRDASDLISAVAVPPALLLSVDLLCPSIPTDLFGGSQTAVDQTVRRLVTALDRGAPVDLRSDLHIPASWVRSALVTGVDRWLDLRIDEGLLAADRALALHDIGEPAKAQGLMTTAVVARLEQYSGALGESGRSIPAAIRRELARLVAAFPDLDFHPASVRPAARGATSTAIGNEPTVAVRGSDVDNAFQTIIDRFIAPPRVVPVDLLHVPARVVGTTLVISPVDSHFVQVSAPAFPGMTADEPAAARLLTRLVETDSGTVVSLGAFTLIAETLTFEGILPLRGRRYDDVTVDVFDSNVSSAPRVTASDTAERDALVRAQRAFVAGRTAAAHHAVGNRAEGDAMLEVAELELSQLTSSSATGEQYRISLERAVQTAIEARIEPQRGGSPLGPERSLICELEAAHRTLE